jgi:hypothetical protein
LGGKSRKSLFSGCHCEVIIAFTEQYDEDGFIQIKNDLNDPAMAASGAFKLLLPERCIEQRL